MLLLLLLHTPPQGHQGLLSQHQAPTLGQLPQGLIHGVVQELADLGAGGALQAIEGGVDEQAPEKVGPGQVLDGIQTTANSSSAYLNKETLNFRKMYLFRSTWITHEEDINLRRIKQKKKEEKLKQYILYLRRVKFMGTI